MGTFSPIRSAETFQVGQGCDLIWILERSHLLHRWMMDQLDEGETRDWPLRGPLLSNRAVTLKSEQSLSRGFTPAESPDEPSELVPPLRLLPQCPCGSSIYEREGQRSVHNCTLCLDVQLLQQAFDKKENKGERLTGAKDRTNRLVTTRCLLPVSWR